MYQGIDFCKGFFRLVNEVLLLASLTKYRSFLMLYPNRLWILGVPGIMSDLLFVDNHRSHILVWHWDVFDGVGCIFVWHMTSCTFYALRNLVQHFSMPETLATRVKTGLTFSGSLILPLMILVHLADISKVCF